MPGLPEIVAYADNETNDCARCRTESGRLADRALSRLLEGDRPRSIDEVEQRLRPSVGRRCFPRPP